MTINVAIKCPDGIVMGADSLVAIPGEEPDSVAALIPYFTKLFPIGKYAAGAMINGVGTIGGRTMEDIIIQFGEDYGGKEDNYSLRELSMDLKKEIQGIIDNYLSEIADKLETDVHSLFMNEKFRAFVPNIEIIVGGYSKGAKAGRLRYGEIYSIRWHTNNVHVTPTKDVEYTAEFNPKYANDLDFGTHYGGQYWMLDRYLFGIDDMTIDIMWKRRHLLFNNVCEYIYKELRNKGVVIPADVNIDLPDIANFDIYKLFSEYSHHGKQGVDATLELKRGMKFRIQTMEGVFSLQTAIDYCNFLLGCAYAVSMFSLSIPTVGSEMRIASITRKEGFDLKRKWEIRSPGPPFVDIGRKP